MTNTQNLSTNRRPRHASHWLLAMAACVAIAGVTGCDKADAKQAGGATTQPAGGAKRDPVEVKTAAVTVGSMEMRVDVVGTFYGDEEAVISAKVPGRVVRVFADVGARVSSGSPLAQIDDADYRVAVEQREFAVKETLAKLGLAAFPPADFDIAKVATVERARLQAANAKAKLDRAKQLFEQRPPLISEQDYQNLQTEFEVANRDFDVAVLEAKSALVQARSREADQRAAQQRLDDTTVRAPGGEGEASLPVPAGSSTRPTTAPNDARYAVTQRQVNIGEYVREGTALYRVVADDVLKFRGGVPERFASQVKVGQPVKLRVDGRDGEFVATVTRINPAVDVQTRTFQIEAELDNRGHALRAGQFARGYVVSGEQSGVVYVPAKAVASFAGIDRVFSVKDGKAVEHRVTRLAREGDPVPVKVDLKGATEVVVDGTEKLSADVPVKK
jgi:multidrug efflux pump subunit AcrA (membrane-fusion protein)